MDIARATLVGAAARLILYGLGAGLMVLGAWLVFTETPLQQWIPYGLAVAGIVLIIGMADRAHLGLGGDGNGPTIPKRPNNHPSHRQGVRTGAWLAALLIVSAGCAAPAPTETPRAPPSSSLPPRGLDTGPWIANDTHPRWPGVQLWAKLTREGDRYHLVATLFNGGNTTIEFPLHCQPRGMWGEVFESQDRFNFTSGPADCYVVDAYPPEAGDDHFPPNETIRYESWFNGTTRVPWLGAAWVPPGRYNWTIGPAGPVSVRFQIDVDWTGNVTEASTPIPGVSIQAAANVTGANRTLEAAATNLGNRTYETMEPACSTVGLFDVIWNEEQHVAFVRDFCPTTGAAPFPPGEALRLRVEWNWTVQDVNGSWIPAPPGRYTWEVRLVVYDEYAVWETRRTDSLVFLFQVP